MDRNVLKLVQDIQAAVRKPVAHSYPQPLPVCRSRSQALFEHDFKVRLYQHQVPWLGISVRLPSYQHAHRRSTIVRIFRHPNNAEQGVFYYWNLSWSAGRDPETIIPTTLALAADENSGTSQCSPKREPLVLENLPVTGTIYVSFADIRDAIEAVRTLRVRGWDWLFDYFSVPKLPIDSTRRLRTCWHPSTRINSCQPRRCP